MECRSLTLKEETDPAFKGGLPDDVRCISEVGGQEMENLENFIESMEVRRSVHPPPRLLRIGDEGLQEDIDCGECRLE